MRHTRKEVIDRKRREFARLDRVVSQLRPADWTRSVPRLPARDPWTVQDALAHILYWKEYTLKDIESALGDVARRPAHVSKSRRTRQETTNQR